MKTIRCSFYAASIYMLITQMAIAQTSESLSGQAWVNTKDGSVIVEFKNLNKLNDLIKPSQSTPNLQGFINFRYDEQGTPNVGGGSEPPRIINKPTKTEDICKQYPFVKGCNQ